nr:methyltransferase domain-containing protein [Nocardioides perillae]
MDGAVGTPFDEHAARWQAYTSSPWGRLRYTLVGRTLAGLGSELGPAPWRVLDVGGGDGLDAVPLVAAGHDVVVVDPSPGLLTGAAATGATTVAGGLEDLARSPGHGSHDLVLCHFVLHYRPDLEADLDRLVAAARPGGLVSVVAPNPHGMVLAALVRSGPQAALAQLSAATARTVTFDTDVRKLEVDTVAAALGARGCAVVSHTGGRVANDLVADDALKEDPEWYAALVELEVALHDREPFRRTGAYWHLVVRTPV